MLLTQQFSLLFLSRALTLLSHWRSDQELIFNVNHHFSLLNTYMQMVFQFLLEVVSAEDVAKVSSLTSWQKFWAIGHLSFRWSQIIPCYFFYYFFQWPLEFLCSLPLMSGDRWTQPCATGLVSQNEFVEVLLIACAGEGGKKKEIGKDSYIHTML